MNGRHSITIAVLSRNQDDVELINSALRDAGHAAHCLWIQRPDALDNALSTAPVELIVVNCDDYPDPVRQVVKHKDHYNPEVPVIALRKVADEAAIAAAMQDGACDLVSIKLKHRLQAVVCRELRALRVERALNSTMQSATEYKRQVQDYMQASQNAIALVSEGIITEINATWIRMFKVISRDEIVGLPLMDHFEADSHAAIKGALIACSNGKWKPSETLVVRSAVETGHRNQLPMQLQKLHIDATPTIQICIAPAVVADQEPTKLVHDALQRDPTMLFFHRAQFIERLQKRLQKKPTSGLHALVYIRPDKFSELKAKVGVLNSEEILAQFAEEVRTRLHPRDIAGRFEGTAIMAVLERGSSRDAQTWGQQLVEHIRKKTFEVDDRSAQLTCTVGVCAVSDIFGSLEALIAATVDAHQIGRAAGGNTSYLSDALDADTKQREFDAIWIKHLKSALMDNRFRLAQLPIAGLRSDSIEMFDLLVRMLDEQGNSVLPSEFLPAAERNNLMKNIDRWMITAAIEFCANSNADRVFVRLSRQSIVDASTASWMEQEFENRKFDCTRLVVQVPEREAAKHIKQTRALISKLRKLGVGFAIEHYGVDQQRFQILDILKPTYIKIDGELMHALTSDKDVQQSVRGIVQAAAERDIKTIAERVENANAMAVLFQLGLDYMQGHYVHEPEVVLQDPVESGTYTTLDDLAAAVK